MTFKEKYLQDHPNNAGIIDKIIENGCPSQYNYEPDKSFNEYCKSVTCAACWDREMPEEYDEGGKEVITALGNMSEAAKNASEAVEKIPRILDSGARHEFESGAVRDIREGKGRCDLLPLDVVAEFVHGSVRGGPEALVFDYIYEFQSTGDTANLHTTLCKFVEIHWCNAKTMFLEVAIHFEEGAKKYGDSNWQKGIPVRCYIDSAVRHYLKFLRGDKDEPHDRAFCWNILCAIWTCKHKPELNDYGQK